MKNLNAKKALPYALLLVVALVAPIFLHAQLLGRHPHYGALSGGWLCLSADHLPVRCADLRPWFSLRWAHTAAGSLDWSLSLPPVITILAGGLFAMLVSVLTGLPFVRLKGMYYSMASMFLGVTINYIIKALKITGGYHGLTRIPKLLQSDIACYYVFLAITVILLLILYRFEFSRIGTTSNT